METAEILILVAIVWAVGAVLSYYAVFKKGYDHPVWYSVFWPVMIPLWLIHAVHNKE